MYRWCWRPLLSEGATTRRRNKRRWKRYYYIIITGRGGYEQYQRYTMGVAHGHGMGMVASKRLTPCGVSWSFPPALRLCLLFLHIFLYFFFCSCCSVPPSRTCVDSMDKMAHTPPCCSCPGMLMTTTIKGQGRDTRFMCLRACVFVSVVSVVAAGQFVIWTDLNTFWPTSFPSSPQQPSFRSPSFTHVLSRYPFLFPFLLFSNNLN